MYKKILPFFVAGCLAISTQAFASDDLETEPVHDSKQVQDADAPRVEHWLTLSTSITHFLVPFYELGGDYAVDRHFSAGASLGLAFLPILKTDQDNGHGTGVRAVGATVRAQYFLLGDFDRGISVGLQGTGWSTTTTGIVAAKAITGSALQYALFVGGKYVMRNGLTFGGQLGYQYNASAEPHADSGSGAGGGVFGDEDTYQLRDSSEFASMRQPILFNATAGWSF